MVHIIDDSEYLAHVGKPHEGSKPHSGRYPWGSGKDPSATPKSFLDTVAIMKRDGMSQTDIAKQLGFKSSVELRDHITLARHEQKIQEVAAVKKYKAKGWSNTAIGKKLGISEGAVRKYLLPTALARQEALIQNKQALKERVDKTGYLDVGKGTEALMKINESQKKKALRALELEGYVILNLRERSASTGEASFTTVLAKPGTTKQEAYRHLKDLSSFSGPLKDKEGAPLGIVTPLAIDPKRLRINYGGEGGEKADGVIYLRPGVRDISIGENAYAQIRAQVGKGHYLKGMAVYRDDLPDGVDLVFNTNKDRSVPVLGDKKSGSILKPLRDDPDNPFGATIKYQLTEGSGRNRRAISAMNIVNDESDWDKWSRNLPSQFLSKQHEATAERQLKITRDSMASELAQIKSLTNPVVRASLLENFAENADSAASHLKAAALPRQKTHVLLPLPSIDPTRIYAPNYRQGERVALVRFPHGGTFEIPELIVDNTNKEGQKMIGKRAKAAVGIHHSVAERLSGADFDGDTALVIPTRGARLKITNALNGLRNFDPHTEYKYHEGMQVLPKGRVGTEMGMISNLITDMSVKGANTDELARAVRHSMVVIDANKHKLDYKQSYVDNDIASLKAKYQGGPRKGASTIISRASATVHIPERRLAYKTEGGHIDPKTGKLRYIDTNKTHGVKTRTGEWEQAPNHQKVTRMSLADDAYSLTSDAPSPMERIYARHANGLKAMANDARLAAYRSEPIPYSANAKRVHIDAVRSLDAKLALAKSNAPLERQAQRMANLQVRAKVEANPGLDKDDIKKLKTQALIGARAATGASKHRIQPTEEEWKAIQAGAISTTKLKEIMAQGDMDHIRELAMPKEQRALPQRQQTAIKNMQSRGYSQAAIAEALGVSVSTVNKYI